MTPTTAGLATYLARVDAIRGLEPQLTGEEDSRLRERARALRERALAGQPAGEQLTEAFALTREAARRLTGMRLYDVQIAGGVALHRGRVAELQTGEGKTLAAVAPVFLNALSGAGVHLMTFNDYLARRDALWMGPVYDFLGVRVGFVQQGMSAAERRSAYAADVTYLTPSEAGFDLLRDGLGLDPAERVQRPLHFALVDEADSILIDEARVPLVVAGAVEAEAVGLGRLAELTRRLDPVADVETDPEGRHAYLTEAGVERVEQALACGSLFAPDNARLLASVRNALHAERLLRRDVDYIVRGGAIELVDEFTGRVAERRQWPDGLHAAVEAKEGLSLGSDGRVLASITLQHLLQLYPRVAGMTATAAPAAEELAEVYGLELAVIPPHRPCARVDHPDLIFTHGEARDRAVTAEIERVHATGRPILVGTVSVAESERLAAALGKRGVPCQVLNAKRDAEEAEIVADAGALDAVTISTNMAGRGTDIRLGGHDERDREAVVALGGLYVLGTHRHESRRIDLQLRGRAGRQGDPGSSRFYLALDDDLLRRSGIERLIPRKLFPDRTARPIDSPVVRREVDRSQRITEGASAEARRRLYDFARIVEEQRQYVRRWRDEILDGEELTLLADRCRDRWQALSASVGSEVLAGVERRLTLLAIDRSWGEHLTELAAVRDEVPLVTLDGREPLAEFYRVAIGAFDGLLDRIDRTVVEAFADLDVTPDGVDWEALPLRGPSATWTYLVSDNLFGDNVLGTMANRASIGLWGAIMLWPVLLAWGIYLRWRRRRDRLRGDLPAG